MTQKIINIKEIGDITFSRNRRSKNLRISVRPNGSILVSYPFYVTNKEVIDFVSKNKKWIVKQKQKINNSQTKIKEDTEIQTKMFLVKFLLGKERKIIKNTKTITIVVTNFHSDENISYIERCIVEIYRLEAKCILPQRLEKLARQHGFSYNNVSIRNNRSKWGSCSSQNNISLNLQMMKMPEHLIDYIILHELVHTKIKNHGHEFWELLNEKTNQQAKKLAQEVRSFSTYTIK